MKFKNFVLDKFQEDAIKLIDKNHSVIVSAPTGTGKTLIADYLIFKANAEGKHIIYTAPIKALSNQKFKQFVEDHGKENVGLLTGDIVINPEARILVMTTEVYRNMLFSKDSILDNLSYVIFDEIHYICDVERGTVWEESIIFSPSYVRFLCLSATIPNADEFANWIRSIKVKEDKSHEINVILHTERYVPLEHNLYDSLTGIVEINKLNKLVKTNYKVNLPNHISLVRELKNKKIMPALYFVFSRQACETKAKQLVKDNDFTTNEEKIIISNYLRKELSADIKKFKSIKLLMKTLPKGIGVHHAGLLPKTKEIVEHLFEEGLIKILYCTETFAVGINMPAKCVCFNSIEKYDGINFRYLNSREYFQIAGRAGRRGIDKKGYAIIMFNRKFDNLKKINQIVKKESEPIISQFKLSFNTVLNLIRNYDEETRKIVLKSNFDYYQKSLFNKKINIEFRYKRVVEKLKKMGYLNEKNQLTHKGIFASRIYSYELVVSEFFATDLWKNYSEVELLAILGAITYEFKRKDKFYLKSQRKRINKITHHIVKNIYLKKKFRRDNLNLIYPLVEYWANYGDFVGLLKYSNFQEGDFIRFFRQIVDLLRQIYKATDDENLKKVLTNCKHRIYREFVEVEF